MKTKQRIKENLTMAVYGLLLILSLAYLTSCKKEDKKPSNAKCNCYERHEKPVSTNGNVSWQFNYNTSPLEMDCSKDNGTIFYNGNYDRYTIECN